MSLVDELNKPGDEVISTRRKVVIADMIEQLVPGLSRREALRQAMVLTGGHVRP